MRVILIRGLPGSGKTTLAKALMASNDRSVHYEADQFFDRLGYFDGSLLGQAHAECQSNFSRAIQSPDVELVVVSNTFTTLNELAYYQAECVKHAIVPQVVSCSGTFGSVHNVPANTVERMRSRWERWEQS